MSVQVKEKPGVKTPGNVCSEWCTSLADAPLYSLIDTRIPESRLFKVCRSLSGTQYYCYEGGGARYEVHKWVEADKTRLIFYKAGASGEGIKFCVHIFLNSNNEVEKILLTRVGRGAYLPEYRVARLLPKTGKIILMREYWTNIGRRKELVVHEKEFNADDTCVLTPCSPEKMPWAQRPIRVSDIAKKLIQVARVALAVYGIPASL